MPIWRSAFTVDVSGIQGLKDRSSIVLQLFPHDVSNARAGFAAPRNTICRDVRAELKRLKRIDGRHRLSFGFGDLKIS